MSKRNTIEEAVKTRLETGSFSNVTYYTDIASLPSNSLSLMIGNEQGEPYSDDMSIMDVSADVIVEGFIKAARGSDINTTVETQIDEVKDLLFQWLETQCDGVESYQLQKSKKGKMPEMYWALSITIQYKEQNT